MLKRKLVKAGLLSSTLLVILAAVNANGSPQSAENEQSPTDTTVKWLQFDADHLKMSGIPDSIISDAPVITLNKTAAKFSADYLDKNGYLLKKIKEQHPLYFDIMDSIFRKEGIPVELKYLAIVESRLKVGAVSKAGAAGAWQLMPVAARMYSLKITSKYDERRNFLKSTVAAARLLKDLHNKFGDWLLVIAAYNSGPGGVYKAIKRSGSRNFWKLHDFLPKETRAHVKRFISTHYFYEQKGSIATLTKDEVAVYRKKMNAFVEKHNNDQKLKMEKQIIALTIIDKPIEKSPETEQAGELKLNKEQ